MEQHELKDIQSFINIFFPFAEELLIKYGEFHPYAGATTITGEFVSVGHYPENQSQESSVLIDNLKAALKRGKDDFMLTGIFYDVRTKDRDTGEVTDAIAVFIEHRDSETAFEFFYPYKVENKENFCVADSYGNATSKQIFVT